MFSGGDTQYNGPKIDRATWGILGLSDMGHEHFLNSTGRHEHFLNSTGRHEHF